MICRVFLCSLLPLMVAQAAAAQEIAELFTGPSVTLLGGYDHNGTYAGDAEGLVYGGALTYDLGYGRARYGLEAEATGSTAESCIPFLEAAGAKTCARAGRDLYLGARAGAVLETTLIYAKAGYTNARQSLEYRGAPTTFIGGGYNRDGYRLGAGVEQPLGRFLLRAEYRYSDYKLSEDRHQVTAGIGFRF